MNNQYGTNGVGTPNGAAPTNGTNTQTPPGYQPPNYYAQYNNNPYTNQPYGTGTYQPPKPPYTLAAEEAVISLNAPLLLLASILFGWVCSRSLLMGDIGIGTTVVGILFYVLFVPFILRRREKKMPLSALLLLIPQLVICVSFSLFSGAGHKLPGLLALFIISAIQVTLMTGCTEGKPFSFELMGDVCSTYLAYPFMNLGLTFRTVFGGKKDKAQKKNGVSSKICLGLLISIPVVVLLLVMLSAADEMFAMWVNKIITALNLSISRILCDVILTALTMLYVMPLVVTLRSGYSKEYTEKPYKRMLDAVIVTTVLFASSLVYLTFVAVQFKYLFAVGSFLGGSPVLPNGLSHAEYCRRGFFELVFVVALTTLVIVGVVMLTHLNDKEKLPLYTKAALLLLTACDFVMMASAAYRVYIYVNAFGMTIARVNAAVLIAFMGICLLATAFKIILEKLQISVVVGSAAIIMLALYSIANVDGFVAKFNVDRYLNDPSKKIDIEYLQDDLSVAAIPQLERLMKESPDDFIKSRARYAIAVSADDHYLFIGDQVAIGRWTVDRQRAVDILQKNGITQQAAKFFNDNYRYNYSYDYDYDDDVDDDDALIEHLY